MKSIVAIGTILTLTHLISACQTASPTGVVNLRVSPNFATELFTYEGKQPKKGAAIIYMHGKSATPQVPHNAAFITGMTELGYDVYAPVMPWSKLRYEGSHQDGMSTLDRIIERTGSNKVIVAGHSMGGMAVLQYGSGSVSEKVKGIISIAPGHDPNNSHSLRRHTEADAEQACAAMQRGEGDQRYGYAEMNSGRTYRINATAEYYCTYYNVDHYPDSQAIGPRIKTPVLLLSGVQDKLTRHYQHDVIFASLPASPRNRHEIVSGDHKWVLHRHYDLVSRWIEEL